MELFGVAIVVLLVGITLFVLSRSANDARARRDRGERTHDQFARARKKT